MSRKNRQMDRKHETAKRQRRAFVDDLIMRAMRTNTSHVVKITTEHVGWRGTVRRTEIDMGRRSIVATHW